MRRFMIVACLLAGIVAVPEQSGADSVTLVNGVEIRNAKITSKPDDHIVTVEIIGLTRIVLGKSQVARLSRSDKKVVSLPPPSEPPAPAVKPEPPVPEKLAPAARSPRVTEQPAQPAASFRPPSGQAPPSKRMVQILKVATRREDVTLEFHVATSPETGITYTVKTDDDVPASRNRTYTIKSLDGTPIKVLLNWDTSGKVIGSVVSPPEPPSDTMEGVYDYTLVTLGGEKFKIRAIWDVLNVELLDTKIIL